MANGGFAALIPGKGKVNASGAQGRIDGRIDNLVEGFLQCGGKLQAHTVSERIKSPPLRVVRGCVLRFEFVLNALEGSGLASRIEHLLECIA